MGSSLSRSGYVLVDAAIPEGSPSGRQYERVVNCVMTSRVLAVFVSVASLACILAFQLSNINTDALFALYDTRTLPYNKCSGADGASPLFRDSIDAFVADVSAQTCANFSDPRSTHGIVWHNLSAVYRYPITVRASHEKRWLWGYVFAKLHPLFVLWWVYLWSFFFQFYYVAADLWRGEPIVQWWLPFCRCRHRVLPGHETPTARFLTGMCIYGDDCQYQCEEIDSKKYLLLFLQAKPAHGAAFLRWVEYAFTSPPQLVFFALLMQNTTVDEAILFGNAQLLICLLGYAVEAELQAAFGDCAAHKQGGESSAAAARRAAAGNIRQYRACFLHLCAWYVHGSLWAIIIAEFHDFNNDIKACIEGIEGAPAFVSAIIYSQGLFFASFGLVQFVQLLCLLRKTETRAAEAVDLIFWYAEAGYGVLNVGSKFCIAVILVSNIPSMSSTSSGGGAGACA